MQPGAAGKLFSVPSMNGPMSTFVFHSCGAFFANSGKLVRKALASFLTEKRSKRARATTEALVADV